MYIYIYIYIIYKCTVRIIKIIIIINTGRCEYGTDEGIPESGHTLFLCD